MDTVVAGRSNQGVRSNCTVGTVILRDKQCRVAINTLFETGMELLHTPSVTAPLSEGGTIQIFRLHTKYFAFVFIGWFAIQQLFILTKQMTLWHWALVLHVIVVHR